METSETVGSMQRQRDEQHLSLLSIFHYIYGALSLLGGCFGVLYIGFAVLILASPDLVEDDEVPAAVVSGIMAAVGGCIMLIAFGLGALVIYVGMCLTQHRNYTLCIIVAALICLNIPFGTILGVFTIVVLARPSVKALFETQTA